MKKRILALPVAALVAVGFAACSDAPTGLAPDGPNFELVDGHGTRVATPNVLIRARFGFTEGSAVSVDQYVGPGKNEEGKDHGLCVRGSWQNPSNKRFAGSVPHAHCVRAVGASQQDVIEMEDISGKHETPSGNVPVKLIFGNEGDGQDEFRVQYQTNQNRTQGQGLIVAHALKNGELHGKYVFDLGQFDVSGHNLLSGWCYVGEEEDPTLQEEDQENWQYCMSYEVDDDQRGEVTAYYFDDVDADHSDLDDATRTVNGFVFWVEIEDEEE